MGLGSKFSIKMAPVIKKCSRLPFIVFCFLNLNFLLCKVNLVTNFCFTNGVGLVGICETWITLTVKSSVVNTPGYAFLGMIPVLGFLNIL